MDKLKSLIKHSILMFQFGSTVYGTITKRSDTDILCVISDNDANFDEYQNGIYQYDDNINNIQYNFITESTWIKMIKEHHIYALEGLWLQEKFIIKDRFGIKHYQDMFHLDKWKLRQTVSQIASNAYAKCHKKLIIEKDFDLYKAQKSLFHSFRVLDFAIQIATTGKIYDYSHANKWWDEISSMNTSNWEDYKTKFKQPLNEQRSEMVKVCPKPII